MQSSLIEVNFIGERHQGELGRFHGYLNFFIARTCRIFYWESHVYEAEFLA